MYKKAFIKKSGHPKKSESSFVIAKNQTFQEVANP
jgi:hypothetical protein